MNSSGAWRALIVVAITATLIASVVPIGMSQISGEDTFGIPITEPDYVVGGDLIVSYDEPENANDALHPAVAAAPAGSPYDGMIYVVWDELDEISGYKEIHFSMSDDSGVSWSNDLEDFAISDTRKDKANNGDAVNPTIAVDHSGIIHVVWSEQNAQDGTWEVMYKRSDNNGKNWFGSLSSPDDDLMISHYYGNRDDADIMSTPEIVVGLAGGKASEILHVVWSERDDKYSQEEIRYSRSFDMGNAWTGFEVDDYISIPDSKFASDPSIAISGAEANNIHVTWKQEGPYGFDEIWYTTSDNFGAKGSWREEKLISAPLDDGMDVSDVSLTSNVDGKLYAVWKHTSQGKAPENEIFYAGSDNGGNNWNSMEQDFSISLADGNEPYAPKISMSDRIVQVVWTELDETSPRGTQEIHTSWSEDPMDPGSWTGSKKDIVLSNGDEWGPANANNVSFEYANLKGEWKPVFVWDEENDGPTGMTPSRSERNTEIHTEPIEWTLTVTTDGSGSVTKNPSQLTYTDGDYVLLTANPSAGWSFDHWELDIGGSTNPYNLLMNDDKSVRAVFVQDLYKDLTAISVSGPASCTEGDLITITRTFQNIGTDASGTFRYGLYLSTNSIISTGDTLVYSFQHGGLSAGASSSGGVPVTLPWGLTGIYYYGLLVDDLLQVSESDEGNNAVASAGTLTITAAQFTLGTSVVGSGTITKNPNQATYGYGDIVTLTANPSAGWTFSSWSGDLTGSTNPDTILMDDDKSVTATFTQNQYTLSTSTSGSGSIIKNPDQATYTYGQTVIMTANPNGGWAFSHWTGSLTGSENPTTLLIDGDESVTAVFIPEQYTLSISTVGSGSIGKSPFQATYTYGQIVTMTAYPNAGWSFDHWENALTGSTNPDTVTITGDALVTAVFTQDQYTLTVNVIGSGSVDKSPLQATYTYGQVVTLTANDAFGWEFDYWTGALSGSTNPDTVTMTGNMVVNCYFNQITHDIPITTGWNLVSIPLQQADTSVATVLSSISGNYEVVKFYDVSDQDDPWKTYRVGSSINDLTNIDHKMAFWVKATAPCTLSPTGEYAASTIINLYTGWNFVGYPTADATKKVSDALLGTGFDMIECYDPDDPYNIRTMTTGETMVPGAGYWIHVTSDTIWTIDW